MVEHTKESICKFAPRVQIGPFVFNSSINNYFDEYLLEEGAIESTTLKQYYFYDEYGIYLMATPEGLIESIGCELYCYLNEVNLIGLTLGKLNSLMNMKCMKIKMNYMYIKMAAIKNSWCYHFVH